MDFTNVAPRAEPAPASASAAERPAPRTISTAAETARPVLAAAKTDPATAQSNKGIKPLDTFEVGDNDYVPVPPEPPRVSTVLAVIANAAKDADPDRGEVEVEAAVAVAGEGAGEAPQSEPVDAEAEAPPTDAPKAAPEPAPEPPLKGALREIEAGPKNPTVDVRR